jgi:hypothetical protein
MIMKILALAVLITGLSIPATSWGAQDGAITVEAVSRPTLRAGARTAVPPPFWETRTVRDDASYTRQNGTGDSALSYPGFAHIAHDPVEDIPFVLWREGIYSGPADLMESRYNDLFDFWTTAAEVITDEEVARRGNGILHMKMSSEVRVL